MKTSDFAWVAIRALGVFLLAKAAISAVEFVFIIYSIYGNELIGWGANAGDQFAQLLTIGGRMLVFLGLYLLAGLYCLFKGESIHSLITKDSGSDET